MVRKKKKRKMYYLTSLSKSSIAKLGLKWYVPTNKQLKNLETKKNCIKHLMTSISNIFSILAKMLSAYTDF